jgi:hypothetical protein
MISMGKEYKVIQVNATDFAVVQKSYSADKIAEKKSTVREPFEIDGKLYVCTSGWGKDKQQFAHVYRLTPVADFDGRVTDYYNKLKDDHGEKARNDPKGFYHGMHVRQGGKDYILTGPELTFEEVKK